MAVYNTTKAEKGNLQRDRMRQMTERAPEIRAGASRSAYASSSSLLWSLAIFEFLELTQYPRCLDNKVGEGGGRIKLRIEEKGCNNSLDFLWGLYEPLKGFMQRVTHDQDSSLQTPPWLRIENGLEWSKIAMRRLLWYFNRPWSQGSMCC